VKLKKMKKNKKGQAMMIITILITSIVGVALLSVLSQFLTGTAIDQNVVTDENAGSLSTTGNITTENDWVVSIDKVVADNGTTNTTLDASNYTVYNLDSKDLPASIELVDSSYDGDTAYVDYTWNPDNYIESGVTRTLISYAPMLFGLAIFVFVAGFLMSRR